MNSTLQLPQPGCENTNNQEMITLPYISRVSASQMKLRAQKILPSQVYEYNTEYFWYLTKSNLWIVLMLSL